MDKSVALKHQLNEDIQRQHDQKVAVNEMHAEQTTRINRQTMDRIIKDVVRQVARQVASSASSQEQQRQALMHFRHNLCDDIRRSVGQNNSVNAMKEEQQARVATHTHDMEKLTVLAAAAVAETHILRSSIHEVITRRGNQQDSIRAMDDEQQVRIAEHRMESICEELVRVVNRKQTTTASKNEQIERITRDLVKNVCEDLRRTQARKQATKQTDSEQVARNNAPTPQPTHSKMQVLESLTRMGSQKEAIELMELEQASRICRDSVHAFCEEVRRTVGRKRVMSQADEEQMRQTAFHHQRHQVCEQVRSVTSRNTATTAAKQEQNLRTRNESGYWVKDPAAISNAKHSINTDIVKLGNQAFAREVANTEQSKRGVERSMLQVCEELVRVVNRNTADKAVSFEKAQRICQHKTYQVCEDLRRVVACSAARQLCDVEQQQRQTEQPPQQSEQRAQVLSQLERLGSQKQAIAAMDFERQHRLHQQQMDTICQQLERSVNASIVKKNNHDGAIATDLPRSAARGL